MKLENITKKYDEKVIYRNFSCEFPDKKITCILGASGCGKTTLLNIIASVTPFEGKVIKESDNISYIFQKPLLLDNLTVEKNIDIVLKNKIKSHKERKKLVENIINTVGLSEDKKKYPSILSGGMEQRVSLARAFALQNDILLMDEPFKGLDISLKKKIIELFQQLYAKNHPTTIFVTHDIEEALFLADNIIILNNGQIKNRLFFEKKTQDILAEIREEIYNNL